MDYSPEVRRRFFGPNCFGDWESKRREVFRGSAEDTTQGVWVRFDAQIAHGRVAAVRYQTFGCPHTVAAASAVAEEWTGTAVGQPPAFDVRRVAEELTVPVQKLGRLLLVEDAVRRCWSAMVKRKVEE